MAREFVVSIPMEEGEPLGAIPNDKLIITKIQSGTLAEGKLKVGDQVLKVNGSIVQNCTHFFQLLRYAPPVASLLVVRDKKKAAEIETQCLIPRDRMKLVARRDGFSYFLARINWIPNGLKLGLGVKHYQNRVLVSRCDRNSLSAQCLLVGDHLLDIDGKPVTDKDVCRELLIKSLQTQHFVTIVVERPESVEAKLWIQKALAASVQVPSVAMNSDVRKIAAREKARLKNLPAPKKSCLSKNRRVFKQVSIDDKNFSQYVIASDSEGKNLRPVRK
ncbi:unnamed protein product [Thelazia callipaeda]|uniref:PDZ domain-containing protein n=1 Tax=Thelazia callipaeda TaxID=103827 RepID=A0A0N5CYE9_THECL|nr:unnamed protein product [Thelazia callipaeda]